MKINIPFFSIFLLCISGHAQNVLVSSGIVKSFPAFQSKYVSARDVVVWLPENYSDKEKYAVLYMHDGQALFDAALTWNKQAWKADEIAAKLQAQGKTRKFIIVGISTLGSGRHSEYYPQKAFESLTRKQQDSLYKLSPPIFSGEINSDNYLKFIVEELKPFVDRTFAVETNKEDTFIAGSSMGGLISLYAICEYPDVFGGAACLSTHWPGTFIANEIITASFINYFKQNLPSNLNHKIYFDYGDQTLDALYEPYQKKVDNEMISKGYSVKNWITRKFPGADHSEKSWSERFEVPLEFLLAK